MIAIDPKKLLLTAQQAVANRRACKRNLHRREESLSIDAHDIKLALDVECQALIESCIHESFPEHAILGEEGPLPNSICPMNGLSILSMEPLIFLMDFPIGVVPLPFSIWKNGAGAVYAPETDELFPQLWQSLPAATGCNSSSPTSHLADAMVLTGMNKQRIYTDQPAFSTFTPLANQAQKIRISGAALSILLVASGRCDAFLEYGLYVWDFAAAGLIAQQAGAIFTVYPDRGSPSSRCSLRQSRFASELEPLWKEGMPHA